MYFEDLTLCRYHAGPLDADSWRVPLYAIGWLENGHDFRRGATPAGLTECLGTLIDAAAEVFRQHHFRGLHVCTLCTPGPETCLPRSHINLWIPSKQGVFAAPAGIVHYLTAHSYLPPVEFVDAVFECPVYGSPQYFESLHQANDGHPVPLKTWNEYLNETRRELEEIVKRRPTRLDKAPEK